MTQPQRQDHPFVSLGFNILAPVLILQKLSAKLGPTNALIFALSFPIAYGAYDYLRNGNKNWISALGIVNTLFTGGFALLRLDGIWFAVKEAAFPLLIGFAVIGSNLLGSPAMEKLFFNPSIFSVDKIRAKIKELGLEKKLNSVFVRSTYLLASSFFLSSALNFFLAIYVFSEIPANVAGDQRTVVLNDQIANMTWLSFVVIVFPLMLFMGLIFWYFVGGLKKLTGFTTEQIMVLK